MIKFAEILVEPAPTPFWRALKQVGVDHAVGVLPRRSRDWRDDAVERPWDYAPLAQQHDLITSAGFVFAAIEDNPPMDRMRLARPGREEEIEQFCTLVRNMGRLGIPVLCYNWMPALGWMRTAPARAGRGGALTSAFELTALEQAPPIADAADADALWRNLRYFLERVVPVAEEAGVRLALHPDDPPLPSIRGMGRIVSSVEALERAVDLVPSHANAITLCQGNVTLMTDDVPGAIRRLGERDAIAFVHFRDVVGTPERFVETFHDEGQTDMAACMRAYAEVGYDGILRSDHTPTVDGDAADVPGYGTISRLHAIGYAAALREVAYGKPAITAVP